jgi:hypothetical protein
MVTGFADVSSNLSFSHYFTLSPPLYSSSSSSSYVCGIIKTFPNNLDASLGLIIKVSVFTYFLNLNYNCTFIVIWIRKIKRSEQHG